MDIAVSNGRSRAKIWELNSSIHCSVIGTCLTTAELRRVMAKPVRSDISPVRPAGRRSGGDDAALTVKRLCRQLGKGWLPLRSSDDVSTRQGQCP